MKTKLEIEMNCASSRFNDSVYNYYAESALKNEAEKRASIFILIDCKSLPRSGLHYMKNTFAKLLGDQFSFCEWYQEPGCCKQMPCALTGYAEHCAKNKTAGLRLLKSHDFKLTDPIYEPLPNLQRVILIRNPLYLLTSWFSLEQLTAHRAVLKEHGIHIKKIMLSHEPQILATAYAALDEAFQPPSREMLRTWLAAKERYITAFINKWVRPNIHEPALYTHIVHYKKINQFVIDTLISVKDKLNSEAVDRLNDFVQDKAAQFAPRGYPFSSQSSRLTDFMLSNAEEFSLVAKEIILSGGSGVFNE